MSYFGCGAISVPYTMVSPLVWNELLNRSALTTLSLAVALTMMVSSSSSHTWASSSGSVTLAITSNPV